MNSTGTAAKDNCHNFKRVFYCRSDGLRNFEQNKIINIQFLSYFFLATG